MKTLQNFICVLSVFALAGSAFGQRQTRRDISQDLFLAKEVYNLRPSGVGSRNLLSSGLKCGVSKVDLWDKDDESGRQKWQFLKLPDGSYNILVTGLGDRYKYLSTRADGYVDIYNSDDGSGRQKWNLIELPDGSYNITVWGGTNAGKKFLSSNADGTVVDLYNRDDGSGRQRWKRTRVASARTDDPTARLHPVKIWNGGGFNASFSIQWCGGETERSREISGNYEKVVINLGEGSYPPIGESCWVRAYIRGGKTHDSGRNLNFTFGPFMEYTITGTTLNPKFD